MILNERQSDAVDADGDLVVVRAPAGSGKTSMLVERAKRELVEGRAPILITFTRSAALEIDERLGELAQKTLHCGTLHSLARKVLREEPSFLPERLKKGAGGKWSVAGEPVTHVASAMKKVTGIDVGDRLHMSGLVTYDEVVRCALNYLRLPGDGTRTLVLVDEAQDLTSIEWEFVRALSGKRFVVGDAAQAIYGWRGGRVGEFLKEYLAADVKVDLEINYRAAQPLVDAANRLEIMGKVAMRSADQDRTGLHICVMSEHLALRDVISTSSGSVAVVARTRRSAIDASVALGREGIPHCAPVQYADVWTSDGGSVVLAALHVISNRLDDLHLGYLLHRSGIAKSVLLMLEAERSRAMTSIWEFMNLEPSGNSFDILPNALREANWSSPLLRTPSGWWALLCELVSDVLKTVIGADWIHRPLMIKIPYLRQACMALQVVDTWIDHEYTSVDSGPEDFIAWLADPHTSEAILLSTRLGTKQGSVDHDPGVVVTTIHGAKGGEWDLVVLWDCVEGHLPTHGDTRSEDSLSEARRLFYVATTRARDRVVYIVDGGEPSRFLMEMGIG